jgi:hypothetical protein
LGFPWQRLVAVVWLLIGAGLLGWLIAAHAPAWTAAHAGWFPPDQPGVCARVAALRAVGGSLVDASPPLESIAAAEAALARLGGGALTLAGEGTGVRGRFDGEVHQAWLFSGADAAGQLVGVVMLDARDGALLWASVGADDPAAGCAFNLRRALRDLAFSPSGAATAIYGALTAIAVMLVGLWVVNRARRTAYSARKD